MKSDADRIYFGYIPLWLSIAIMIIYDYHTLRLLRKIFRGPRIRRVSSTGSLLSLTSATVIQVRPLAGATSENPSPSTPPAYNSTMSPQMKALNLRLTLVPLIFILVHIPGSVNRISQLLGSQLGDSTTSFFRTAQALCEPSEGVWNYFIWVLTDPDVLREWGGYFRQYLLVISEYANAQYERIRKVFFPSSTEVEADNIAQIIEQALAADQAAMARQHVEILVMHHQHEAKGETKESIMKPSRYITTITK